MADDESLARLRQGVSVWNAWRDQNRGGKIDLSHADLSKADLSGAQLNYADLSNANLTGTDLSRASLCYVDFTGAHLESASLYGSLLQDTKFTAADLSEADLSGAYLDGAHLDNANLTGTDLSRARLMYATLVGTNIHLTKLDQADLRGAYLASTVFAGVDLSTVEGLDLCVNLGFNSIDASTLQRSGRLSRTFLMDCGLSDWEIEVSNLHQPDLNQEQITDIIYRIHHLRASRPIQIHRLFISYSHADNLFLEHMEEHLNKKGVRFWRDVHDAPSGPLDKIVVRAMRENPVVLLVLSENSVNSDWVEYEAQTALDLQKQLRRHVLCPIAIDKSWLTCNWSAVLRNQIKKYNVLDFSSWQNDSAFEKSFDQLLSGIDLFYLGEEQKK